MNDQASLTLPRADAKPRRRARRRRPTDRNVWLLFAALAAALAVGAWVGGFQAHAAMWLCVCALDWRLYHLAGRGPSAEMFFTCVASSACCLSTLGLSFVGVR